VTIRTPQLGVAPPTMEWQRRSSSEYTVRVHDATVPFVLTLSESFSEGWRLTGLADGDRRPLRVNGYANGWTVAETGDLTLTLRYAPDLWARRAIVVSLGALVVLGFLVGVKLVRVGAARPKDDTAPVAG
jgi:hypothetical protein